MKDYKLLMSPLKVGNVIWKNRIQTGPMSMTELGYGEKLSRNNIEFYRRLAEGGAAVVTIGESIIPTTNGKTHSQQLMLGNPEIHASLVRVVDAIHAYGALADIEISHGGYMADPIYNNGNNLIGPCPLHDEYAGEVFGMDENMMDEVANAFSEAVDTVRKLGFDMAMIHAGHGWLLSQFLSPLYNRREDAYGGSVENRMRFPLMVLERVRDRVGKRFTLDMRVSGSEFLDGGADIEDCVAFCKKAQEYVDIINVSAGAPWTKRMVPTVFEERGINAVFAAAVKKEVAIPVTTVGGFSDPEGMEDILKKEIADGLVLGRGIVADPDIPNKILYGKADTVHKCIRCFVCNEGLYTTKNLRCAINPAAGREFEARFNPSAKECKKVLIAGGGPGGLTAAVTAARRGHKVILFEKSDSPGGLLKDEWRIPFKKDLSDFVQTLALEADQVAVEIRLNTVFTPEIAERENADAIFAAIGASPVNPPIEGRDMSHVELADAFLRREKPVSGRVAVIGGGLVGAELSMHLAMQGIPSVLIEMRDEIILDATQDYRRYFLAEIEKYTDMIKIETKNICRRITKDGILSLNAEGLEVFHKAAHVVIAVGYAPRRDEAEAFRPYAPVFRLIGDCVRAAGVYEAVRDGYDAAMNL
jgi:2,4-dienoyl-CoA reductase-like NADH-dependent reductase (Old Yellow Enzyme family)/thioredoxin reductase